MSRLQSTHVTTILVFNLPVYFLFVCLAIYDQFLVVFLEFLYGFVYLFIDSVS